ncbi:alpha-E domain-containing protein [Chthonobacter rhizosphaerae]|uniref:alpha-E domain-containing protein n=1 Tax=Chthonobacter rhizosphaerae TaxID=2735553 RepID=UPI0015EEB6EA|nr:alpha-E domain-containing protein [Chthonobacter rhizosphaerae]
MLSRHADNLFWLARYVERAENTARLLEAAARLSAMPVSHAEGSNEWEMAVAATGTLDSFKEAYGEANARTVVEHLAFSTFNPSSIRSCMEVARTNARAVRTALTMDMWETINSGWLEMRKRSAARMNRQELSDFLAWVKEASLRFDGSAHRTMLRNDAYYFLCLGSYIERADFTARILNVKADVLTPDRPSVGGGFDYYQWSWILRSVSALTSYHWVYRENLKPHLVADLLILRDEMPRSLVACYQNITRNLDSLARDYGRQGLAQRKARSTLGRLQGAELDEVFKAGLPEYLDGFINENAGLGAAIAEQYLE